MVRDLGIELSYRTALRLRTTQFGPRLSLNRDHAQPKKGHTCATNRVFREASMEVFTDVSCVVARNKCDKTSLRRRNQNAHGAPLAQSFKKNPRTFFSNS